MSYYTLQTTQCWLAKRLDAGNNIEYFIYSLSIYIKPEDWISMFSSQLSPQPSLTIVSPVVAPTEPLKAFLSLHLSQPLCFQCPQPPSRATSDTSSPTWFQAVEHHLPTSKHFRPHGLGWSWSVKAVSKTILFSLRFNSLFSRPRCHWNDTSIDTIWNRNRSCRLKGYSGNNCVLAGASPPGLHCHLY